MSFFRDLIESVMPTAYAEEKQQEPELIVEETPVEEDKEEELEEDEEIEEDEDEDELVDPMDTLKEECEKSTACHEYAHHFQECVDRVTKAQEDPDYEHLDYKEDCVEEFFHLQHCINDCVAPKLFFKLK